jgi:hypothetical protein
MIKHSGVETPINLSDEAASMAEAAAVRVQAAARGVFAQRLVRTKRTEVAPKLPAAKAFANRGPVLPLDARAGYACWQLTVQVVGAARLLTSDGNAYLGTASSDPMVLLGLEGVLARTSVQRQTTHPAWPAAEATFVFKVYGPRPSVLQLAVWDWDPDGLHDPLGHAAVPLFDQAADGDDPGATTPPLGAGAVVERTLSLVGVGKGGRQATGTVTAKLLLEPAFATAPGPAPWPAAGMPACLALGSSPSAGSSRGGGGLRLVAARLAAVGARGFGAWALAGSGGGVANALDRELDKLFEKQVRGSRTRWLAPRRPCMCARSFRSFSWIGRLRALFSLLFLDWSSAGAQLACSRTPTRTWRALSGVARRR